MRSFPVYRSSVQACLETEPGLLLQQVDPQPDHIRERIIAWMPDVLILETGLLQSAFSISLLHDFPQMKLIGLVSRTTACWCLPGRLRVSRPPGTCCK